MAAVGNYEVVEQSFSTSTLTYEFDVAAPGGKVVLGGGIEFDVSDSSAVVYDGWPAADGSKWTFFLKPRGDFTTYPPYTGVARVTCAELGTC
jgi:hypothetical protein